MIFRRLFISAVIQNEFLTDINIDHTYHKIILSPTVQFCLLESLQNRRIISLVLFFTNTFPYLEKDLDFHY